MGGGAHFGVTHIVPVCGGARFGVTQIVPVCAGARFVVTQYSVLGSVLSSYSAPLPTTSETQSVSNQSFADDTQPRHSCPPDQVLVAVLTMQTYLSD